MAVERVEPFWHRVATAVASVGVFGVCVWGISIDRRMSLVERDMQNVPPKWLTERVAEVASDHARDSEYLALELRRQQRGIDRLEGLHQTGNGLPPLPPYSSHSSDPGELASFGVFSGAECRDSFDCDPPCECVGGFCCGDEW